MLKPMSCKLLVIGAGPGGYVCAIRAGQLGIDTVIVEALRPGGTCLNIGCIPSKALIHAAEAFASAKAAASMENPLGIFASAPVLDLAKTVEWKKGIVRRLTGGVTSLLKKSGVKIVGGKARFRDGETVIVATETGDQEINAENIVIATGSAPVELPFLPFGGNVISSREALKLAEPPKNLVVVGGGYIGLELGMAYAKLGSLVSVVEAAPHILPLYDEELSAPVLRRLRKLGVEVLTNAKALGLTPDERGLRFERDGKPFRTRADKILVAVGRRPYFDGLGLEELAIDMEGRHIRIDERCRTTMRGIYAIGDATGDAMLAHRAMAQGEMVAEIVAGHKRVWEKQAIPAVCFTDPEVVSVGLGPAEAKASGREIKTALFPFAANGRAMTLQAEEGFVRVVARADNHVILGIQAVGAGISELSAAFGLALEMGARLEDVAATIHAHPTMGEAFPEAAMRALGKALHI